MIILNQDFPFFTFTHFHEKQHRDNKDNNYDYRIDYNQPKKLTPIKDMKNYDDFSSRHYDT